MMPTIETQLVKAAENALVVLSQIECPVSDVFAPGVYCREIFMPASTFVVGHLHKTEHLNILLTGRCRVLMNGKVHEFRAPFRFKSYAGVRKVLFILEDCTWMTVHPTEETDREKIREAIIDANASAHITDRQIQLLLLEANL
jgi:hypothetical protein